MSTKKIINSALLVFFFSMSALAADEIKYAAIQKEDGKWKVASISDSIPTYRDGMEILALPRFEPVFDKRFQIRNSSYGGIECPTVSDKTMYTPCNSYFFRFVGANFFGLSGVRVGFVQDRLTEVKKEIASDERVADIKAKADEAAAARAQLMAKRQEEEKMDIERRKMEAAAKHREEIKENLEKMSKVERGLEDSCHRVIEGSFLISKDPSSTDIVCQFGGLVELQSLPSAGWLVVSKTKNTDDVVTDYFIRKAR